MKKSCTFGRRSFSAEKVISNEDLRREILLRLPVTSLIRFNLVSKQWSSLISDPQFTRDRTCRLSPSSLVPSGLYFESSISNRCESVSLDDSLIELPNMIRLLSLSFATAAVAGSKIIILQSCNGLLFCQVNKRRCHYCVCNPATRKFKKLPPPRIAQNERERLSQITLVFDPSVSPHYKVVCLIDKFYIRSAQTDIYSSDTSEWVTYSFQFDGIFYQTLPFGGYGLYWNGSIPYLINERRNRHVLYNYDLENNKFKICDVPRNPQSHSGDTLRYFGECNGHLHLVYVENKWSKKFRIFERNKETLQWSVKYHVRLDRLISKFPEVSVEVSNNKYSKVEYAFSILTVYKGEKEKDSALVLKLPGKIVSYNLHDKSSKVLRELPYDQGYNWQWCHHSTAFNYIETFASV